MPTMVTDDPLGLACVFSAVAAPSSTFRARPTPG